MMNARSVAVIGASPKNGVTNNIFAWADAMKTAIDYWPVNPKYDSIAGLKAYPSLHELPYAPDVVAVAVGPRAAPVAHGRPCPIAPPVNAR